MKPKLPFLALSIIAVLLFIATTAYAMGVLELPRWSINSGGGAIQGDSYTLNGTVGQPVAAQSQGGNYRLSGGFWEGGEGQVPEQYHMLLPITLRR